MHQPHAARRTPAAGAARPVLARAAAAASVAASALALSGCVGLIPDKNDEAARKQVTQVHAAEATVTAPFGSRVEYGWGQSNVQTGQVDNTGHWSAEIDAPGIVNVFVTVTPSTLQGSDASASCDITIGTTDLAKNATVPGMESTSIQCLASTAATP